MPVDTTCISTGMQCAAGTISVRCDTAADCPGTGNVCCGHWDGSKYSGTVMCQGESNCVPPMFEANPGDYPLCNYPGGTCPNGMVCKDEPFLGPGHGYCFYN